MIIGISGKKGSGKDTLANIIEYITDEYHHHNGILNSYEDFMKRFQGYASFPKAYIPHWRKKMFAEKLKQIVCLLIGCTMEQLEDQEFKEKELGEEWWHWRIYTTMKVDNNFVLIPYNKEKNIYDVPNKPIEFTHHSLMKLTPRMLLQLIGTECGRNIVHPNIWVNALMNEYTSTGHYYKRTEYSDSLVDDLISGNLNRGNFDNKIKAHNEETAIYPNWIITDVRFPNEAKAIKDKRGIIIRIDRLVEKYDPHESETALDGYESFNYRIDNNRSIDKLIHAAKYILQREKIIK